MVCNIKLYKKETTDIQKSPIANPNDPSLTELNEY